MLIAPSVRPLEDFFEWTRARPSLKPNKEVAISLSKGLTFCLCDSPRDQQPRLIRTYHVDLLQYDPHPILVNNIRWEISSDRDQIWEGNIGRADFYNGLLIGGPDLPIRHRTYSEGQRVVFKFNLPSRYRIHHLQYLQRNFPETVMQLAA